MNGSIIQIAGVRDRAEAELLIRSGAHWLGLPIGPGVRDQDLSVPAAARLIRSVSGRAVCVCITYLDTAAAVSQLCRRLHVQHVQIHGPIDIEELRRLRRLVPDLFVLKSLIVRAGNGSELRRCLLELAPFVDAFITDTFDPDSGACGATGRVHDWQISRALVAAAPRPVILAGGLTPENVGAAIAAVRPAGVDAHTGVEDAAGAKDPERLRRFVAAARAAFVAAAATGSGTNADAIDCSCSGRAPNAENGDGEVKSGTQ